MTQCAHCVRKANRAFSTVTTDGSPALDLIHGQLAVSAITPVFRTMADEARLLKQYGTTVLSASALRTAWLNRVAEAKRRYAWTSYAPNYYSVPDAGSLLHLCHRIFHVD